MADFDNIQWEDVKTGSDLPEPEFLGNNLNEADLGNIEWEDVNPVTQSVMDDRDQKVYNVPVSMDGVDATYAIDTQHKGVDKDNFFGKVQVFNESTPSGMLLKKIGDVVRPAMMKLAQSSNKTGAIKRGVYDNAELWADYAWGKMAGFEIGAEQEVRRQEKAGLNPGMINRETLLGEYANTDNEEEAQKIRLSQEQDLVKELKRFREITHGYFEEKREAVLPAAKMSDIDNAVQQLTNGMLQGGESVATMFVTGNPIAGAALMSGIYGDMKSQNLYEDAITQGKSIDEAEAIGLIGGTIEGGIEMASDVLAAGFAKIAPLRKLTDSVIKRAAIKFAGKPLTQATAEATGKAVSKQLKSVAKEGAKAALTEGAEEFFQGTLGDWWSNITGLTDISFKDSVGEAFTSFLLALPVGGLMGSGGTALYNRMTKKTNDRIKEAVKKSNPDISEDQAQKVADGLQEIFFQEAAPQYMKEINNLVEKQVSPDVMPTNFTDITTATVKMLKEKFGMSEDEIMQTVKAATNAIDVRNSFAVSYNYFRDELELAGRNPVLADKEARLYAARMTTVARNEGVSVDEILKKRGVKVAQMKFADFMAGRKAKGKAATISREDIEAMRNLKNQKTKGPQRQSLLAFIKDKGGLKDVGGDLKAMDAGKQSIGLINNTSGNSLDDMALAAWEAGYFEGQERPDINTLLEAIRDELFGNKRYSSKDGWDQSLTREEDLAALRAELERIGVDVDNDNYSEINRKISEAQDEAQRAREGSDYANLSEDDQERYAMMRENGASHEQAMAAVQNGADDEILFQFAGENAQTAALDELERAKQLEADGVDNEEIRQQTGWFKGADGKWRFEISDKDATINRQVLNDIGSIENLRAERDQLLDDIETFKKEREKNNDAYPDGYLDELISQRYDKIEKIDYDIDHGYVSSAKTTLGELLNHDKLYDAYPSLRYMPVTIRTSDDLSGGAYSRKDNTIYLDSRLSDDEIKSILMHEIQHVIQEKENFARGGNIQFAKDYKKIIEKKASAEFMDLLDKKMKEGLERELKEYNLNKEAIVEILDAYSDYTKKFFDADAENEEVNKAEKKYYETLEKHNISSDILENAMNNLRDQGIWKEAENEVKYKNKLSDADAYEIYRAFFGEVEARNTQARMDLTEEERRVKTPESTQDVANADALVVMPDGTAMAYKPEVIQKFYQGGQSQTGRGGAARGAYSNNIIYLFEHADASTVTHEMAHYFLDDLQKYGQSDKSKEELQAIYDYLGVKDGNITQEQHEYFADSFEVYLKEGKAPNRTLASVFNKFKTWLKQLFSEVKRLDGIKLTDEMRKTFDNMLGGKSLDFAMQISGQKMAENARSGYISPATANLAVELLKQGKMSRADMDYILEKLKNGEMARSEVYQVLKKFEAQDAKNNEQLNPFDTVKYREALLKDNVNKAKVLEKIETLMKWAQPREVNGRMVGRFPNKRMNDFFMEVDRLMHLEKEEAKQRIVENKGIITAILESKELPSEKESVLGMRFSETDRPELLNALALENRVLSVATKELSVDNAVKLYNDLQDSYNEGRLTANVTGDLKRERKQRMIGDAIRTIVGDGKVNPKVERGKIRQFLNRFGTSQMSWGGLMDILSMNDASRSGQSALSKMMDVFTEEQNQAQWIADDGEKFSKFFEAKLQGANNGAISVSKYINNELNKKTTIAWDSYRKTFTKDELIDIYMKAKDKETKEIMLKDTLNGYNENFLNVVNQSLNADDRAFADALFDFYDDNWKKINAFYEEKYGITMPKSDYYSPRTMLREGISVSDGSPAFATSGFTKKRTAKVGASVDIQGAFKVWNNYVNNTNRWLAWSDKLVDINSVFGNNEVKKIIENLFGENMNKRIRGEVERMAGSGGDKFSAFFSSKLLTKIRGNYAKSVLALKPALMIKQLTSFPAYWNEMSAQDFATGLADFFTHPKEAIEILGNTTLMKTRGTDIIRDFAEISKMDILKGKKGIKWSDAIMINIKLGDRGAIYMGGWALYKSELKKNLAQGMSEEEAKTKALERFERVTDETQQSGRLSQQSYWQSNPALRMFTMFQSSQNQYLRKEIGAVRGVLTGRMDKAQAAKTLFIFHVLLPCLFQFASDGFDWDKEAQLRAAVLGSLNGVFVLNSLLTKIYDHTINRWVFDIKPKYGKGQLGVREIVPFWASVEDLAKEFEKLANDDVDLIDVARAFKFWDSDEFLNGDGGKAASKIIKAGGELTGIPLKYPLDVIKNFGSYAEEGKYRKELLLYLGWSPYALRENDNKIELLDF